MSRLRRLAIILGVSIAALLACVVLLLWIALKTGAVQAFLRDQMLALLQASVGADVRIGRVEVSLDRSLVIHDLHLGVDGRAMARIPRLRIEYAPSALARGRVLLRRVVLTAPWVRAVRTRAGWRLPQLAEGGGEAGLPVEVEISRIEVVNGRLALGLMDGEPVRVAFADVDAVLGARATRDGLEVVLSGLEFVPRGMALSAVGAAGALARLPDGAVCLHDVHVATRRSRVDVSGCIDPGVAVNGVLSFQPLDARDARALVPASPLRTSVTARLDAEGPWRAAVVSARLGFGSGGRARGTGIVDLRADALGYGWRIHFADVDPAAVVEGGLSGRLTGRARGREGGQKGELAYRLALDASEVAGHHLDALRIRGHSRAGVHELRARIDAAAGGATLRGTVSGKSMPTYDLRSRATLRHVEALLPGVRGRARVRVALRGEGSEAATAQARVTATVQDASISGIELTGGTLQARVDAGVVHVEELAIEGPAVQVQVDGTVDVAKRSPDLAVQAALELDQLGAGLGVPASGALWATGSLRGPLDVLTTEGTVTGQAVTCASVSADDVRLVLAARRSGAHTIDGSAHLTTTGLRVGRAIPRVGQLEATWKRAKQVNRVRVRATAQSEGGISERLTLSLRAHQEGIDGVLEELFVTPSPGLPWTLAEPAPFTVRELDFSTTGLTLAADGQRISLAGRVAGRGGNDAVLTLADVNLGSVCAATGLPACGGLVTGRVELAGTAAAPQVDSAIAVSGLQLGAVDYGLLEVVGQYQDRAATLNATARRPGSATLDLEATIPVDLAWAGKRRDLSQAPLLVALRSDGLDLGFLQALAPQHLRQVGGQATVDLRLTGTREALSSDGRVTLAGGSVEFTATGVPYSNIRASMTASGTRFQLSELHANSEGGALEGSGYIDLTAGDMPQLSVVVRFQDFLALRSRTLEAVLSGKVGVQGPVSTPEVVGDLDVTRMVVRPPRLGSTSFAVPEGDPTIEVVGDEPERVAVPEELPKPALDPVRLGLDMRLARNAWVRHRDANIELAGDFRVDKAPYEDVQVRGDIDLVRGWYAFQGRRFYLKKGDLTLSGGEDDPHIDVTGEYRARGYSIFVHVHGPSSSPVLELSAEPYLDEADILSVLIFGKPASELSRDQAAGLEQQTAQLASQYVIGELGPSVRDTLGLDTVDVELPEGADDAGQVTVGRYVTRDVFLSLGQEFGSSVAQVFGAEYGITPRIVIRGSTSTDGRSAVDVFWRRRY